MKVNIGKGAWGFVVELGKDTQLLIPKKKSFSIQELVAVITTTNDLWKVMLEALQKASLSKNKRLNDRE